MVNQQDPRVKKTRRAIEQSFWELMKSRGFDAVSISHVTKQAGINRATFYAHYADKSAVLSNIAVRAFRGGTPADLLQASKFSEDVCRRFIEVTYDFVFSFYDVCGFDDPRFAAHIDYLVRANLCTQLERSLSHSDAAMVGAAIYSEIFRTYVDGEKPASSDLEQKIIPFVMKGIGQ